jgi:hypothetical protein
MSTRRLVLATMTRRTTGALFGAALIVLGLAARAEAADLLQVTADATTITATGVTPGATVVFFSVSREVHEYTPLLRRADGIVADTAKNGRVSFRPPNGLPPRCIVAAVELESGRFAIGSRPEIAPQLIADVPGNGFGRGVAGELTRLRRKGDFYEILVVRPGTGAWSLTVGDGGPSDADRASDHAVTLDVDRLMPLAGTAAPPLRQFRPGDVVIGVETRQFACFVAGVRE